MEENQVNATEPVAPETPVQGEAPQTTLVQAEVSQPVNPQAVCQRCGAVLATGQAFCPACGQKVGEVPGGIPKKSGKKKLVLAGAAAAVVVLAVVLVLVIGGSKTDFNKMYPELAGKTWCTIASDGSYMEIDDNPYDTDEDDLTSADYYLYMKPADDMIQQINKDLGFSEALYQKMCTTTWSQGKQTESNDKYTVTYTYHPNQGLEVMYEVK